MNTEDFEKRAGSTPLRRLPPHWRGEILAAARRDDAKKSLFALVWLRDLLWPHPYAWGALAACWLVIATLNFSGPRGAALYAVTPPGVPSVKISTDRYAAYLRSRNLLLAANFDQGSFPRMDRRKL